MKLKPTILMAAVSAFALSFATVACDRDTPEEEAAEQTADNIEDAAEERADALEDRADQVRDEAEEVGDAIEDRAEREADRAEEAADSLDEDPLFDEP